MRQTVGIAKDYIACRQVVIKGNFSKVMETQ